MDGQDADMRSAVVSIDPKTGGVKAYYGGSDAQGFDFAQAGLPTGSSFKVFALVAALEQGMGLGYQVDSSPVESTASRSPTSRAVAAAPATSRRR